MITRSRFIALLILASSLFSSLPNAQAMEQTREKAKDQNDAYMRSLQGRLEALSRSMDALKGRLPDRPQFSSERSKRAVSTSSQAKTNEQPKP